MSKRVFFAAALVGGLASYGLAYAQDNQPGANAPPAGTGSKTQQTSGSKPPNAQGQDTQNPAGAPATGSGSKVEALPPPDSSTAGPKTGTGTPVPNPSGTSTAK